MSDLRAKVTIAIARAIAEAGGVSPREWRVDVESYVTLTSTGPGAFILGVKLVPDINILAPAEIEKLRESKRALGHYCERNAHGWAAAPELKVLLDVAQRAFIGMPLLNPREVEAAIKWATEEFKP